jgi:hypothetical protein
VVGFFWFCVRQGWIRDNPAASMGRIIAKHVPVRYSTGYEYAGILSATYRLKKAQNAPGLLRCGICVRALTERSCAGVGCTSASGHAGMLAPRGEQAHALPSQDRRARLRVLPHEVADLLRSIPPGRRPETQPALLLLVRQWIAPFFPKFAKNRHSDSPRRTTFCIIGHLRQTQTPSARISRPVRSSHG